jgi:hypothetical protein
MRLRVISAALGASTAAGKSSPACPSGRETRILPLACRPEVATA